LPQKTLADALDNRAGGRRASHAKKRADRLEILRIAVQFGRSELCLTLRSLANGAGLRFFPPGGTSGTLCERLPVVCPMLEATGQYSRAECLRDKRRIQVDFGDRHWWAVEGSNL
jgi:hypothetical protein